MSEYDVVIIGAGAAGCVLAARMSEDPSVRVLLLEAGPAGRKLDSRIPAAFPKLFRSKLDWADETAPEPGLAGRSVFFPHGRAVGGSTAMNAQIYTRGHAADFAAWADEAGPAWGSDAMDDAFGRVEAALSIERLRDANPLSTAFVRAARDCGLPHDDEASAARDGVGIARATQRRGMRFSAADAYLRPARGRRNLEVVAEAVASELTWRAPREVGGVAYTIAGQRHVATARRAVILCAGAIGSPQLLMRSGIGPAEHLRAHGIEVRHDLAGVGQGLRDHVLAPLVFGCRASVSLKSAEAPRQLLRYLLRRRGMLTSNVGEAVAFVRSSRALPAPDLELIFAPVTWLAEGLEPPVQHGFTIGAICVAPRSGGQVALRSASPSDRPVIRAGYLSDPYDLEVLVRGARLARRIAAGPALQAFGDVAELEPTRGAQSDEELGDALRAVAQTIYHPACTNRMGRDALAVVDPELRVCGVRGLRVADASVMPTLVRGHTQAATYAIAERAADLLHAELRAATRGIAIAPVPAGTPDRHPVGGTA